MLHGKPSQLRPSPNEQEGGYVLAWTTAFDDRHPVYMYDQGVSWGATEDRSQATVYPSARAAIEAYREKHTQPDHPIYVEAISSGSVRAERVDQLEMAFSVQELDL